MWRFYHQVTQTADAAAAQAGHDVRLTGGAQIALRLLLGEAPPIVRIAHVGQLAAAQFRLLLRVPLSVRAQDGVGVAVAGAAAPALAVHLGAQERLRLVPRHARH